ncbi:MAG: ABC transporter ATP-binding protein [Actinomycetota bacterium]|nr:ABC transporter ATP-binding protein [Actinomycetota bacterium]
MHSGVTSLVEVEDLHVHFGPARAVDGASLQVEPGEVLALVGESGSGKTTLIRAIQGLQKATSGEIRVEGNPVDAKTKRPIQTIFDNPAVQMVFQDPTGALNPRQTIYEVVAEGLRIHGQPKDEKEQVAQALSRAGLRPPERFFGLYPHEISGGQRQRVVIAGAMVMEPRLLLADEPVASLDASIRGEILALMRRLVDETGLAILVVTHDLGLAWNIADRVAVMYLGRIVETGPTEQILIDPKHPYTRALLSVVPETREMEQQILIGEIPDPARIPSGCRFHPRCPLLQSGTLSPEIATRCPTDDPGPVAATATSAAACWAVTDFLPADFGLDPPSSEDG